MKLSQASDLVMSLKGAGISCLVIMWAMRKNKRNWNRNDLATHTGWSRESVAMGLERLTIRGLTLRTNFENWQLSDNGYQLNFADLPSPDPNAENGNANYMRVENFDSHGGGGFKENHELTHDMESLKPLLLGVENIDSKANHEPLSYRLIEKLISYGAAPKTATSAIETAIQREKNLGRIEARILWWRGYTAKQDGLKHPGNLIAARVGAGINTPADFSTKDFPWKLNELQTELEDLERSLNNSHEPNEQ